MPFLQKQVGPRSMSPDTKMSRGDQGDFVLHLHKSFKGQMQLTIGWLQLGRTYFILIYSYFMPVCSIVQLLPKGAVDDLMHFCTRPKAKCNSASGRPRYRGVIVWTILQTGMK